jgi:TetR/AcrR family transcriptional regulator of autoinduction and epiphytic fitness
VTTTPQLDEPIDGRTARAVRTRDGIVEACLGLIDEGDVRPTGPRIAERAGVSVRSVFQHFDDLESLFAAVGDKVTRRMAGIIVPIDPCTALTGRIEAFADQRARALESLTPVLRAAMVYAASSDVITRQFHDGHAFFREQVAQVFGPELAATDRPDLLRDALVAAASWPTWDLWRSSEGRTTVEASEAMAWLITAALVAAGVGP